MLSQSLNIQNVSIIVHKNGRQVGMSEESVDIHIRLSQDGARMLQGLMIWGNYRSKSAYIEEMIFAIEDIFSAYYTNYKMIKKAKTDKEKKMIAVLFDQYLLPVLRRLGWPGYRDQRKATEKKEV